VIITEHEGFTLVNSYFPSGRRGHERVQFKLRFYDDLRMFCQALRKQGKRPIVCGDFNTAHRPIDLVRAKENQKTSGFLPEEREALDRWVQSGFIDAFRHLQPNAREYSWWTYRFNARARNIGWRLDYHLVAEELIPSVEGARILGHVLGSDHCPVELSLTL
jgi:exodeoxyribonuclease-3